MFSFRGDAHKIYLKLKCHVERDRTFSHVRDMEEVREIMGFYEKIDSKTLKIIYYRMLKEQSGSGIIPILITAIPWFLFLFSNQLQKFLLGKGYLYLVLFSIIYFSLLFFSVILHFREKAWATFHINIICDILNERKKVGN
ncbi:hypothetical protein [Bacillus sinesaloumensis]|uniref:hypothetical protein n=1 Tax=Litchfieldia sinesaloumensis TaxID=1926280 RepID=UPI000988650A|nr:hypothetical protein [Bacillus sinesaloumensis]